jgi:hypothetical protein
MFNVDWGGTLNGVANPGYPAQSTDYLFGARYRMNDWTASVGLVHFGTASTANPEERGQNNSALITTAGLSYDLGRGLSAYTHIGQIQYKQLGLSPMTMPANSAFTQVDSRVSQKGNWGGAGLVYTF